MINTLEWESCSMMCQYIMDTSNKASDMGKVSSFFRRVG